MDVNFRTAKLEKIFSTRKSLIQVYGKPRAKKIMIRIAVLQAASCLAEVPSLPPERCHELSGEKKGEFAVDLDPSWRLVFCPAHEPVPRKEDGGIDLKKVTAITIISVEDYH